MKKYLSLISIIILSLIIGCATTPSGPTTRYLTILHTNDHHGRFWKNANGEYGMPAQKTLVDRIREEMNAKKGHVILLSGGDVNTGAPESDLQKAKPDFKAMSAMGYDAMVIGNHEFDKPREALLQQKKWADFPFLAANIMKPDKKPLFKPFTIVTLRGLKVAILGLITSDTPKLVTPSHVKDLSFLDPVKTAANWVPKLREKADIVVVLSHLGYNDGVKYGNNVAPDDVDLAKAVPGIDVIVGGHSHSKMEKPDIQNGTIIVQAGDRGRYIGRLDLKIDNGGIVPEGYRLIPVNKKKKIEQNGEKVRVFIEEEIPEDQALTALLTPYFEKGRAELDQVIGNARGDFIGKREIVRTRETNLGNLIARAQRLRVGADIGVINSGGIRTGLKKGKITYKDVLKVQPFSNTVCMVTLTGNELIRYIQTAANMEKGSGAFAQFDNIRVRMKGDRVNSLKVDGKKVKPNKTYTLAVNSFAAEGGDGYMKISDHPTFMDTGYVDAEVLKDFIVKKSPLKPKKFAPTNDVKRD